MKASLSALRKGLRDGRRPAAGGRAVDRWRRRNRDDAGFTLTELLIASTLLVVLLTVVMVSMSMVESVTNNVTSQYQEYDQALPALAPLQTLIRAEVEPGPTTLNGGPTPGFGVDNTQGAADSISGIGNYSLTFYASIGTAYHNVTSAGTTGGPAMIVAEELDASGNPVTSSTVCSTTQPCSFQVREYLPTLNNSNGVITSSCPFTTVAGSPPCQYGSNYTLVSNAADIVNSPASDEPIFTYTLFDTVNNVTLTLTSAEVDSGTITNLPLAGYPAGTADVSLSSCTAPGAATLTCPADDIQSVGVDLRVAAKGAGSQTVENDTVVYRYPEPSQGATYPYQYSTTTG
jgi:prepilin-type N-terminal cleavage/methylation domain-containing protein